MLKVSLPCVLFKHPSKRSLFPSLVLGSGSRVTGSEGVIAVIFRRGEGFGTVDSVDEREPFYFLCVEIRIWTSGQ